MCNFWVRVDICINACQYSSASGRCVCYCERTSCQHMSTPIPNSNRVTGFNCVRCMMRHNQSLLGGLLHSHESHIVTPSGMQPVRNFMWSRGGVSEIPFPKTDRLSSSACPPLETSGAGAAIVETKAGEPCVLRASGCLSSGARPLLGREEVLVMISGRMFFQDCSCSTSGRQR